MSNRDARYAQRKVRELLRLIGGRIGSEAREMLSKAVLMEAEARKMFEVSDALQQR